MKTPAGWAWLILASAVTLYVAGFDIWASLTGHETMSGRFRDWLFNPVTAPFIVAAWVGLFAGLSAHWLIRRQR